MSEVEFAGVKFKGGRMLGIILALSTLVGGAYGGFEVYKDYMDMKEVIKNYEPPDLSRLDVFAERTANLEDKLNTKISNMERLLQSEISTTMELVGSAQRDARDIRNQLTKDMTDLLAQISAVDKRSRQADVDTRGSIRTSESDIRSLIQHAEDRFDSKRTAIESDATRRSEVIDLKLKDLEERLRKMLERALNNPLTGG
mgnify:FL=1|tara:strand:+ start:448 stop:1047 length:600 start_codon:yes stop_codon:yes gene_type:complete